MSIARGRIIPIAEITASLGILQAQAVHTTDVFSEGMGLARRVPAQNVGTRVFTDEVR